MGYYTFPHTRTYDSDLGWLICQTKKLLEMYDKWDELPDMIKEILEEYIHSGEINEIIEEIIGDFVLNPKYPPSPDIPKASGDGSTDDTASIQGCIDYAAEHGKLGVYFPTGAYLTGSLTLKAGVSLFGSDRYTTRIVLKAGATSPLLSGNVSNMGIHRLTLDSNAGNQVNNITTVSITAGTDIEFNDLIFASGYVNLSYLGTSGHLQLSNIIFAEAVIKHLLIAGTADVQAENLMFEKLSAVSGNCCMDISTDHGSYRFTSEAATPACVRCSGSGNRFDGFIHNAVENIVDTGTGNDYIIYGSSQTETLLGDKKLTAANITEQISGDKTVTAGDMSETAANKTVHITQDMTEQVDGTKTETLEHAIISANDVSVDIATPSFPITFPDKSIDLHNIGYISVKDYGAKGDGLTDDHEAIQNAINNNPGKAIFFDAGTYLVSDTLILPKNIVIIGVGQNSIIRPSAQKDVFKSIDFDQNVSTPPSSCNLFIEFYNITLLGNFYSDTDNFVRSGETTGSGIKLYGNQIKLFNVTVSNFPEYGLYLLNVPNLTTNPGKEKWHEPIIAYCSIGLNGKDGIYSDYLFDYNIVCCSVNTSGQSDTNYANKYANLRVKHGNVKIVNSHFSSLYGNIKPYYSILLEKDGGNSNITNSHIEGAYLPLSVNTINTVVTNCVIYSSFGDHDVEISAQGVIIDSCVCNGQVSEGENKPTWKGAFKFTNSPRNVRISNLNLNNTEFYGDDSKLGYVNDFDIMGWSSTNKAADFNFDYGFVKCHGDFGSQSSMQYMGGQYWTSELGLPIAKNYNYINLTGDVTQNVECSYNIVLSYTQGKIKMMRKDAGGMWILVNATESNVPVTGNNFQINDRETVYLRPNTVTIAIGNGIGVYGNFLNSI